MTISPWITISTSLPQLSHMPFMCTSTVPEIKEKFFPNLTEFLSLVILNKMQLWAESLYMAQASFNPT